MCWRNTTFGSAGPIEGTIQVDPEAATLVGTIDLGGNVFGAADPDPIDFEFDLMEAGAFDIDDPVFGPTTMELAEDGTFVLRAPDVPGDRIASMVLEGALGVGTLEGAYTIEFEDGGEAEGEIEAARV